MWLQRRSRDAVAIVMRRINTRIEDETFLQQNVQRPERTLGDRETRSAVGGDSLAEDVLQHQTPQAQIEAELCGRLLIDEAMGVAVTAYFMTGGVYGTDQVRLPLRDPTQDEERGPHTALGEK